MGPRLLLSSSFIVLFLQCAKSDDTSDQLLKGINAFRASLNLSTLTENSNAKCLADQTLKQFKDQPCANTTGFNTVPGTTDHCEPNDAFAEDAVVMPACIPDLDPSNVLTNFTKSEYSGNLKDGKFVGAGIAEEGGWVVVVLGPNTTTGNSATSTGFGLAVGVVGFWRDLTAFLALFLVLS